MHMNAHKMYMNAHEMHRKGKREAHKRQRCYTKGVDSQIRELILDFYRINCTCDEPDVVLSVAGCRIELCRSCLRRLEEVCVSYSRVTPHCITLHYDTQDLVTLSFCTGSLMRFSNSDNRWVDSASVQTKPSDYSEMLSSISLMIPFLSYISPTRAANSLPRGVVSPYETEYT
jgi:hypothetical protein